jgi:heat shock protein HtpX
MEYIGIQAQISRNNRLSILYLIAFPLLILGSVYLFLYLISFPDEYGYGGFDATEAFAGVAPVVIVLVSVWFAVAYFAHGKMIKAATSAHTLSRKENMRVYNLVENLCMQEGMRMPKINIIEDPALNAFASGLTESTYTVTLTRGIIETLNDEELKGVIAHELMHIKNRDVRLLVITIIFVGIFSFAVQVLFRSVLYGGGRRRNKDGGRALLIALIIAAIAYFLSLVFKFGLSRSREYMADSGAAEMTKNPLALASALRKISRNSVVKAVKNDDVKQMFIEHKPDDSAGFVSLFSGLFATHPPIEKRIKLLEQY